jgi:hypothetical protein
VCRLYYISIIIFEVGEMHGLISHRTDAFNVYSKEIVYNIFTNIQISYFKQLRQASHNNAIKNSNLRYQLINLCVSIKGF